jgi:hypothetical protein
MKNEAVRCLQRFSVASLMFVLFAGPAVLIPPVHALILPSAEITVRSSHGAGSVKVDGETTLSGRTFFPPGVIETSETSTADIDLNKHGKISLSQNSALGLGFGENSVSARLISGKVRIASREGVSLRIETPDDVFTNDPATPTVFTLDLASGTTIATIEAGTVVTANGEPAGKAQTTSASRSIWLPLAIFGGAVGAAVIAVLIERSDDEIVSPVR